MLQGILIIRPPGRLLLGEIPNAVGAAIGLVDPGLPDPLLGVPADPQEMGEPHPACCVYRPAPCTIMPLTFLGCVMQPVPQRFWLQAPAYN